jgi:hypothetical protein
MRFTLSMSVGLPSAGSIARFVLAAAGAIAKDVYRIPSGIVRDFSGNQVGSWEVIDDSPGDDIDPHTQDIIDRAV